MPSPAAHQPCRTCDRPWAEAAFYANSSECKECKRGRSRRNRAEQARKVAAVERLVDVLTDLAERINEYGASAGPPPQHQTRRARTVRHHRTSP